MKRTVEMRLNFEVDPEPMLYLEIKEDKQYRRIAKRPPGQSWISLEPGLTVYGGEPGNYDRMSIEYHQPVEAH
jgi:hypothetical protein